MHPVFYFEKTAALNEAIVLDEDTSKHIVQVLRMRTGEWLELTDGRGSLMSARITDDHKKKVVVKIQDSRYKAQEGQRITVGISLLKNPSRFEWFLEKATEIGITEIVPLICERTERQHFRLERLQNIVVSAMLQSRQSWFPVLREPVLLKQVVESAGQQQKFIAHCIEGEKESLAGLINKSLMTQIILIGPEGDFTDEEVRLASQHHFLTVSLGENRLRAETAGVVAATLLKLAVG
jgi:16S rRNA (uracil1498-N3)-methyltransferase